MPPERLLKASLLIALYSVCRERAFCEALEYNLLYCWFLDMDLIGTQLQRHSLYQEPAVLDGPRCGPGPVRRGGVGGRRGGAAVGRVLQCGRDPDRGRNEIYASTTDPEVRLLRKGPGKEALLAFLGHALMENRHGLLMDFTLSPATGTAERDTVPKLLDGVWERGYRPRTLGADRGYDDMSRTSEPGE